HGQVIELLQADGQRVAGERLLGLPGFRHLYTSRSWRRRSSARRVALMTAMGVVPNVLAIWVWDRPAPYLSAIRLRWRRGRRRMASTRSRFRSRSSAVDSAELPTVR